MVPTPSPGVPMLGCNATSIDISSSQFGEYDGCYMHEEAGEVALYRQTGEVANAPRAVLNTHIAEEQVNVSRTGSD